jgi:lipopolysaccharide exporter
MNRRFPDGACLMKLFRPGNSWSQKVVHAGFWSFAFHWVDQLFILCRIFVLAALLSPRDFGLYGMAMLCMVALETVSATGFEQALIHQKQESTSYLEVVWTVRLIRGLVLAALFFEIAPWAAAFFEEPAATPLMRVLSLSFVFQGLTNTGVVDFQKKLEFHKEFAYRFSGILVDLVVAVVCAYLLRSALAFVLGTVAGSMTRLLVSYWIHPLRPRFRFDAKKSKELFSYGMWMLFVDITEFVSQHGASIVIGKIIGAEALGLFQTANRISNIVVMKLGTTVNRVAFPAYAELQRSVDHLQGAYKRIAGFSATLFTPAAVGIICVGPDFTRIFLGLKWMPMVPAVLILSIASLLLSMAWTGQPAFMGRGHPQVVLHMQLTMAVTVLLCIYPLSVRWGINGAAVAVVVSSITTLAVWYINIRREIGLTMKDIGIILAPPLIASILMAGALYGLRVLIIPLLPGSHLWDILWFVCMILSGAIIYFALIALFQRCLPNYQPMKGIAEAIKEQAV